MYGHPRRVIGVVWEVYGDQGGRLYGEVYGVGPHFNPLKVGPHFNPLKVGTHFNSLKVGPHF